MSDLDLLIPEDAQGEQYQLFGLENDASNAADGVEFYEPDEGERRPPPAPEMKRLQILAYSIGHFMNDLCSALWFSFLLTFLEKVVLLTSVQSGFLMLLGQVTDALSTPIIGLLSDASILPGFLMRFGRRKAWHIIGTCCVAISFPFIYTGCLVCNAGISQWLQVLWFVPFIMIFQFGWAATQIAHLALIPELSTDAGKRGSMNSGRNAFTVLANLTVYITVYVLLRKSKKAVMDPSDLIFFQIIGVGVIVLGLIVTSVFYFFVKEPQIQARQRVSSFSSETSHIVQMSWRCWFSQRNFYLVGLLYMLSRLYVNISQAYLTLYVTMTRKDRKDIAAILFIVLSISSFVVSCILGVSRISRKLNRKALFMVGSIIGVTISFPLFFFIKDSISIYISISLMGIAQALLLISSLGMTSQLINKNIESGAFVYGIMSFVDKLSNGIVIQVIELINPSCKEQHPHCKSFYRNVMSFVPGSFALLTIIVLLFLNSKRLGRRDAETQSNATQDLVDETIEIEG